LDVEHTDVPYDSNVQWLSLGKVLRRMWVLQEKILMFLGLKDEQPTERRKLENWHGIPG
jgi:hypothetical protein